MTEIRWKKKSFDVRTPEDFKNVVKIFGRILNKDMLFSATAFVYILSIGLFSLFRVYAYGDIPVVFLSIASIYFSLIFYMSDDFVDMYIDKIEDLHSFKQITHLPDEDISTFLETGKIGAIEPCYCCGAKREWVLKDGEITEFCSKEKIGPKCKYHVDKKCVTKWYKPHGDAPCKRGQGT